MATYTNLGIKKITTGDESGTWGTSTNTNFDYFDTAIVGYVAVTLPSAGSSGTPNTINVADFSVSDGRNRVVEFVDAGDLGATAYVQITPNDFEGYYFIQNSLSGGRSILLFQGTYDAGRDYEIPSGKDVVVRCTGGGSTSYIYNILDDLQINSLKASLAESTGLPVSTGISGLGTGVATFLATPSSANLAAAVTNETGSGSLVFATSPTLVTPNIGAATGTSLDVTTVDTTNIEVTNIKAKDGTASMTIADSTGVATINSAVLTTADINGGTIDGTTIGATSSTTGKFNFNSTNPVAVQVTGVDLGPSGTLFRITYEDTVTLASTVSSTHVSYNANPTVPASATLGDYYAYLTYGVAKGAGATVSNQYGFIVSNLTEAANNYAFYANLGASGTSRYNFYAAGTAPNYFGGNTIVSVTDNTNAALRVTQLGTANALEIEDSTNPDATPFIVDASGRLIQGYTTAVASKILTTATTPNWQVHSVVPANYSWTNNATFPGFFLFNKSKSGVVGTLSAVTDGDNLGIIQFNGADNDATPTFNPAAYISAQVAGTVASTSIPGRLNFATTAAAGTSPTVRASITPEGYLGIGATPTLAQQLVDVRASNNGLTSDSANNTLRFTDTDTTTAANQPIGKIEFYSPDTDNATVGAYILASSVGTAGGGTIRFGACANGLTAAEVARVASTGLTVTADTAGLGYGTGTGGTVTQATSRTTGVTLNKTNGAITLVSAAGTATWQSFTVTNSTVAATDVVILSQKSGTDLYMLEVTAVAAGSFRISFATTGGTTTEQPVFNFVVIKAVAA